jgi:Fe-S-cluster containining protein
VTGPVSKSKKNKARPARTTAATRRNPPAQRDVRGRVHLALFRDPASGQEGVALVAPVFGEPWQNEIAVGAANTAHAVLRGAPTHDRAVELARSAMAATSRLVDGLLARAPAGAVACKSGCDHCCYQGVGVTPPEALAIADHLRRTRSLEELERITAHLAERREKTRDLSAAERFSPDHPCPFLERAHCTIYEVRPLSCRGMNSLDADECATRLRDPDARAAFLENGSGGRSFIEPIRAFHAVSAGLQLGLSELYQLDMRPLDLTLAVHLLLTTPGSTTAEWLRGLSPFEEARGSDSSGHVGIEALSGRLGAKP